MEELYAKRHEFEDMVDIRVSRLILNSSYTTLADLHLRQSPGHNHPNDVPAPLIVRSAKKKSK